jgi:hypothetical protein
MVDDKVSDARGLEGKYCSWELLLSKFLKQVSLDLLVGVHLWQA